MMKIELLLLVALMPLLAACGSNLSVSDQPEGHALESSQGKPTQPLTPVTATAGGNVVNPINNESPQSPPKFKRGGLLNSTQPAETQAPPDPYLARYDKSRLDKAAHIHRWVNVSVTGGIEAVSWTRWTRGAVQVRVAVMGPRDQLAHFNSDHQALIVHLQDNTCNSIKMMTVPLNTLKTESPRSKGEIETMVTEGQLECSLEDYERIQQWIVEWN